MGRRCPIKTAILACRVIRGELEQLMADLPSRPEIHWIDTERTHIWPDELRAQLQEALDSLQGVDRVLLAFGSCGNALLGLQSPAELIFPRVDDCVSLLLGSCARRQALVKEGHAYFMNKGWVDWPINLWTGMQAERARVIARWGEEKAARLLRKSLLPEAYTRLVILDTGLCPLEDLTDRTEAWARDLGLRHEVVPGDLSLLATLLRGPWDPDRFITLPPGEPIAFGHLVPGAGRN